MSPLVRSLLALAALLATARTQSNNCATKLLGLIDREPTPAPTVLLSYPGGEVDIAANDICQEHHGSDSYATGEMVTACNNAPDGPPPTVVPASPLLEKVFVWCRHGCPEGVTVDVVVYCT